MLRKEASLLLTLDDTRNAAIYKHLFVSIANCDSACVLSYARGHLEAHLMPMSINFVGCFSQCFSVA